MFHRFFFARFYGTISKNPNHVKREGSLEIIARMGKPEDLSDEESGEASGSEKQKGTICK